MRIWWKELLGMVFYYSEISGYFYAWNYKKARKKRPGGRLWVVNSYGEKIICNDKYGSKLEAK